MARLSRRRHGRCYLLQRQLFKEADFHKLQKHQKQRSVCSSAEGSREAIHRLE